MLIVSSFSFSQKSCGNPSAGEASAESGTRSGHRGPELDNFDAGRGEMCENPNMSWKKFIKSCETVHMGIYLLMCYVCIYIYIIYIYYIYI